MLKALSVIFLILGWIGLLNSRMPIKWDGQKQFFASLSLLAIGTIITFVSFVK